MVGRSQQETDEPTTRTNFDKASLRRMYRKPFEHAIATQSAVVGRDQHILQYGADASSNAVQVFARKRPLFPGESETDYDIVNVDAGGASTFFDGRMHADMRRAYLDCHSFPIPCLPADTTNAELCNRIQLPELLQMAREGGNGTCLMFGQTGSGKTHSMAGIMEAAATLLFTPSSEEEEVEIHVSSFQVAGKDVLDLLSTGEKLAVREDSRGVVQVSASQQQVTSAEGMLELLRYAGSQRLTDGTLKNADSSRSHAFYRISVKRGRKVGSLTFVDLAGSERGSDSMYHTAEQRKQGAAINASLAVLKDCVRLQRKGSKRVPYRNNRLTMLLRQSFQPAPGSAARMVLLVTVSPGAADTEHSISTMRNACLMAGLEPSADLSKRVAVSLIDCEEFKTAFKVQHKHPSKWDATEVAAWFTSVAKGTFADVGKSVARVTDGKALARMPEARFQQLCNSDARRGSRLYQLLKEEIEAANRSKAKVTEAIRNAKSVNIK